MAKEIDKSLGDQNTLQGAKPAESAQRSLGDRSTFSGGGASSMVVQIVRERFMRYCLPLALIWFVIATYAADPSKSAVPDEASQKETLAQIQSIYKADYEKSKTAAQKLEMAQKMLKEANGTKDDPVAKFVLLRVARDIAAQQGGVSTAFESIDRIANAYEVDAVTMKIDAARTALKVIKTPVDHQRSLEQLLPLVDSLLESEQYDAAKIVANMALSNARGTRDANTVKAITAKVQEIDEIVTRYQRVEEYATILKNKATDPQANLELGRFRCLVRGDWERGIPMLALGADETLQKLAAAELEEKVDHLAAGDAWWEYGEAQSAIAKKQAQSHAVQLYLKALPQLSGLKKKRVEQRIASGQISLIKNSIGMPFKLIYPGTFTMGSAKGGANETPHEVTLTKPYYLGVFEVTQEQYAFVMKNNPSNFKGATLPVERVTWDDAVEFCRRLSALPKERAAGRVYRLPTEAEWEYACRAGTTTEYSFGDEEGNLSEYTWFVKNSANTSHPVGQGKPNAWGLYDMHGNVWEWCQDWYGDYPSGSVTDPTGPSTASSRVFRGGGWGSTPARCRSAYRGGHAPSFRNDDLGFRVALSSDGAE